MPVSRVCDEDHRQVRPGIGTPGLRNALTLPYASPWGALCTCSSPAGRSATQYTATPWVAYKRALVRRSNASVLSATSMTSSASTPVGSASA